MAEIMRSPNMLEIFGQMSFREKCQQVAFASVLTTLGIGATAAVYIDRQGKAESINVNVLDVDVIPATKLFGESQTIVRTDHGTYTTKGELDIPFGQRTLEIYRGGFGDVKKISVAD